MLLGLYLLLVIALPVALGALVIFNGLPRTRTCPACADETIRLRSLRHAVLSRALQRDELHERWCPSCAWVGTARIARPLPAASMAASTTTDTATRVRVAGVDVRHLDLDGGAWHVRLECWAEQGSWRGRLQFVGPGGRAWSDGRPPLTGRSAVDVLSQVLALPDDALAGRIRKAIR